MSKFAKAIIRGVVLTWLVVMILGVGLARIHLGSHSLIQVCFGYLIGILYSHMIFMHFYKSNLSQFSRIFTIDFKNRFQKNYILRKYLLYIPIANLSFAVGYYFSLSLNPQKKGTWQSNMESKCPACKHPRVFEFKDILDCLYINMGILFTLILLTGNKHPYQYTREFSTNQTWMKKIFRSLVFFGLLGLACCPDLAIKKYSPESMNHAVLGKVLTCALIPIAALIIVPFIFKRTGLSVGGDIY